MGTGRSGHQGADKRVLVLNHFGVPPGSPGGTRHAELFRRLDGWQHLIVAARRNALTGEIQDEAPGFRLVDVAAHDTNGVRRVLGWVEYAGRALVVGLRNPRPDVVYASSPHLLAGVSGLILARLRGAALVLEVRDVWPEVLIEMGRLRRGSRLCRVLERTERVLYGAASAVVILAEGSRAHVSERSPVGRPVVFVPNGADPDAWTPTGARDELRARYGFTRFTAVYVGAHGPANGLELLLKAATDADDAGVDIALFGGGVEKEKLRAEARALGLRNVRFFDPVPKSEVKDVLGAADVGLHILADVPLFANAVSPNKIFDYMAAGLPIVTNAQGVSADLVGSAACGWSVGTRDLPDGFRSAVALSDPDRRDLGARGSTWLRQNRSHARMAEILRDTLDRARRD